MKKISRRSFLTAMAAVSAAGVLAACGASSSTASSVASSVAASSETAASSEAAPESVTIKAFNGAKELVDVEVPFDPQRIAILDLASLDILDELGVGDRVVGTASTSLDYLQSYVTNESIANLGNIKEADMEAVMACEPDIIFIGGRLSKSYDALCEIAPVVLLATDAEKGVVESTREDAMTIASIFGLEDHVEALKADFDSRIDALKAFAEGKTAIIGMTKTVAKELGSRNITVNAVAPGFIKTPMTDALTEEQRSKMLELVAMKRYGDPQEVASVISFLCSEDASYVTGQVVEISGGLMM